MSIIRELGKKLITGVLCAAFVFAVPTNVFAGEPARVGAGHYSITEAQAISLNKTVSDNIVDRSTSNWYKFELKKDGNITISFSHTYIDSGSSYWKLDLYNDEKEELNDTLYYDGDELKAVVSPKIGLAKGVYYIEIDSSTFSDVQYNFSVNYEESTAWEKELNDTIVTANKIGLNKEVNGGMGSRSDKDYYVFTLTDPGCISLTFSHPYINSGSSYWKLQLLNDDKEDIYDTIYYDGNVKDPVTSASLGLGKGTYYIEIQTSSFSDVNYKFTVNYEKSPNWERELNNTIVTSNLIGVNKEVNGGIGYRSDKDYYVFTINEPGYVSVTFSHKFVDNSSSYWRLMLENYDEKELMHVIYQGREKDAVTSEKHYLQEGTYYILVESTSYSDQNYKFTVNFQTIEFGWLEENGKYFWYENGERQGTVNDPQGVWGDGTNRGREIYDSESDGWYWLDSVYGGAKAVGKEVWMPYIYQDEDTWSDEVKRNIAYESDPGMGECVLNAIKSKSGKWVRYDENGKMLKGWVTIKNALAKIYPEQKGNTYYYDSRTGLMAKGKVTIDGVEHYFNETSGVLEW